MALLLVLLLLLVVVLVLLLHVGFAVVGRRVVGLRPDGS